MTITGDDDGDDDGDGGDDDDVVLPNHCYGLDKTRSRHWSDSTHLSETKTVLVAESLHLPKYITAASR